MLKPNQNLLLYKQGPMNDASHFPIQCNGSVYEHTDMGVLYIETKLIIIHQVYNILNCSKSTNRQTLTQIGMREYKCIPCYTKQTLKCMVLPYIYKFKLSAMLDGKAKGSLTIRTIFFSISVDRPVIVTINGI